MIVGRYCGNDLKHGDETEERGRGRPVSPAVQHVRGLPRLAGATCGPLPPQEHRSGQGDSPAGIQVAYSMGDYSNNSLHLLSSLRI